MGLAARLLAQVREDALRHFGFLAVLDRFSTAFEAADVDWVVLKGPVLAEIIYGATSRGYTDLDLMVPARQLPQAIAALETAGADLPVADWAEKTRSVTGEFSMAYAGTPFVDLHWHLVNTGTARRRYALPVGEVLDRRQRVRLGPLEVWSLEPTDFAIHVALQRLVLRWPAAPPAAGCRKDPHQPASRLGCAGRALPLVASRPPCERGAQPGP